jgi:DNA-binding NarL/FixJ family response regulator
MTSILIADDHGIVREGLKRLLEAETDFNVCAEASDGREVLAEVERTVPDVVVLDINMPGLGGLETLAKLRAVHPDLKVVLLSVHGEAPTVHSAAALGANGYVLKNGQTAEVVSAVRAVTEGGSYFSPPIARELVERIRAPRTEETGPLGSLSAREREVLKLIAEGFSAKEVGRELSISAKTVEAHRTSLMRKLGTRKATELVRYALRHGLVEP